MQVLQSQPIERIFRRSAKLSTAHSIPKIRRGDWRPGTGGPPPWANGRGRGRGRGGYQTNDYAFQSGFTDGYEAGLDDGRDRRRFDPVGEGRYRSGDRGYRGDYGTRDAYKFRYREAFREGYEDGYGDGQRYDSRNTRNDGRPTWWPWS